MYHRATFYSSATTVDNNKIYILVVKISQNFFVSYFEQFLLHTTQNKNPPYLPLSSQMWPYNLQPFCHQGIDNADVHVSEEV